MNTKTGKSALLLLLVLLIVCFSFTSSLTVKNNINHNAFPYSNSDTHQAWERAIYGQGVVVMSVIATHISSNIALSQNVMGRFHRTQIVLFIILIFASFFLISPKVYYLAEIKKSCLSLTSLSLGGNSPPAVCH